MPMKRIYILLTKTKSVPSRIIGLFTRAAYTHAAIAFEDEPEVFYSFSRLRERFPLPGGLTTESPDSGFLGKHWESLCRLICLEVSDRTADRAQARVRRMMKSHSLFRYSLLGCVACRFGIAHRRKGYYFCSQFVGEVLEKSGAASFGRSVSLLRPDDFLLLPHIRSIFCGTAGELANVLKAKKVFS